MIILNWKQWWDLAEMAFDATLKATSADPQDLTEEPEPENTLPIVVESKTEEKEENVIIATSNPISGMRTSKEGLIELANYEALSHTLYLCTSNVRTIGIGMTISEIKDINKWSWTRSITTEQACTMFKNSVVRYENAVKKALQVPVTQAQFDVLVSITYNIGTGGMKGSTFMRRINAKAPAKDVVAAMKSWNKGGGRVVQGLVNRRNKEGALYLTGKYENNGTVGLIKVNPTTHRPIYSGRINISKFI